MEQEGALAATALRDPLDILVSPLSPLGCSCILCPRHSSPVPSLLSVLLGHRTADWGFRCSAGLVLCSPPGGSSGAHIQVLLHLLVWDSECGQDWGQEAEEHSLVLPM